MLGAKVTVGIILNDGLMSIKQFGFINILTIVNDDLQKRL